MATPEQIAQWRAWLSESEVALHSISVSGGRVLVRMGDRQIQYSEANKTDLINEIARLKALIAGKRPGVGRINYVTPY